MKALLMFIKTTLAGGFLVVLPMMIVYMLLEETFEVATALAKPFTNLLPENFMEGSQFPHLIAIVLIVLVSLLFGLVIRTGWGKHTVQTFEHSVLGKIPGYSAVRSLSRSLVGDDIEGQFESALLSLPMDGKVLAIVVERHEGGECTVFLPSAPTPGIGTIQVVPSERLKPLDAGASQVFEVLSQWGVGTKDILSKI